MRIVVIASHPDDEMLGMAVLLASIRFPLTIVHITDGAPRSGQDARNAGCATWQEYTLLRRRELKRALALAGISATTLCLQCPDQEAARHIANHAVILAELFDAGDDPVVFTHPYEGGHPDHDATAAAVHGAVRLSKRRPLIFEFASYHARDGRMECECFLDGRAGSRALAETEHKWKRKILSQFESQRPVLDQFPLRHEPLRAAPSYDFSRPPHPGELYYQRFEWGPEVTEWQILVSRAFQDLGVSCVC